jgi:hypothetical protein
VICIVLEVAPEEDGSTVNVSAFVEKRFVLESNTLISVGKLVGRAESGTVTVSCVGPTYVVGKRRN